MSLRRTVGKYRRYIRPGTEAQIPYGKMGAQTLKSIKSSLDTIDKMRELKIENSGLLDKPQFQVPIDNPLFASDSTAPPKILGPMFERDTTAYSTSLNPIKFIQKSTTKSFKRIKPTTGAWDAHGLYGTEDKPGLYDILLKEGYSHNNIVDVVSGGEPVISDDFGTVYNAGTGKNVFVMNYEAVEAHHIAEINTYDESVVNHLTKQLSDMKAIDPKGYEVHLQDQAKVLLGEKYDIDLFNTDVIRGKAPTGAERLFENVGAKVKEGFFESLDAIKGTAVDTGIGVGEGVGKGLEIAGDVGEKVLDTTGQVGEKVLDATSQVGEKVLDDTGKVGGKVGQIAGKVAPIASVGTGAIKAISAFKDIGDEGFDLQAAEDLIQAGIGMASPLLTAAGPLGWVVLGASFLEDMLFD